MQMPSRVNTAKIRWGVFILVFFALKLKKIKKQSLELRYLKLLFEILSPSWRKGQLMWHALYFQLLILK